MSLNVNQTCNDFAALFLFVLIFTIVATAFILIWHNIRRFQAEIHSWRKDNTLEYSNQAIIGDDGELVPLPQPNGRKRKKKKRDEAPNVYGCLRHQMLIALIGLITAIISALAATSPLVTVNFHSVCNNVVNVFSTPVGGVFTETPTPPILTPTASPFPSETPTMITTSTPAQRFYLQPLVSGVYWPNGYNIGLTTTRNSVKEEQFLGIPFEIGRQINTPGCPNSSHNNEYLLRMNIANPAFVYFLLQAGNGFARYENDVIGRIELYFSDGAVLSQDLILGVNIRDWARDKSSEVAVVTVTSPMVREAWQGEASEPDAGWLGGIDMLTVQVSPLNRASSLTSVKLLDTTDESINSSEPCIHLQAVTVEVGG